MGACTRKGAMRQGGGGHEEAAAEHLAVHLRALRSPGARSALSPQHANTTFRYTALRYIDAVFSVALHGRGVRWLYSER